MVANYLDEEDLRRERERHIVEEGRSAERFLSQIYHLADSRRALWMKKKQDEREILFKDIEELRELGRRKMFGR